MKKKTLALFLLTLLLAASAHAQELSAEEIVKKHIAALGGASALGKRKAHTFKGTIKVQGMEGTVESYSKAPGKTYQKVDLKYVVQENGTDGTRAWRRDQGGLRELSGAELTAARENAMYNKILSYKDRKAFSGLKLLGTEEVEGRKTYKVQFTYASGNSYVSYFDAATFLEARRDNEVAMGQNKIQRQVYYSDFREVNGVKLPFKIRQVSPFNEAVITVESYDFGAQVKDSVFEVPKEAAKASSR
jgi:zinc protease